jgi:hypothetical protein
VGTGFQVDIEDAFEQPGPAHASEVGGRGCLGLIRSGRVHVGAGARDNRGAQFRMGRKHAMEADEVPPRAGHQRGEALLFGVTPTDAATFGTTIATLAAVAVLAGLIPAVRASRLDPVTVLRNN